MKKYNTIINDNNKQILNFLESQSFYIHNYIKKHLDSKFLLISKYITHSDLICAGKRNGKSESLEKNFLYYLTVEEMKELEILQEKKFESAKQSNITLPSIFYETLNINQIQRRKGKQKEQHNHICINDYAKVYLVNDSLYYFNIDYTLQIIEKLKKETAWKKSDLEYKLQEGDLTEIHLTHAIHGIGTSQDEIFRLLRFSIFKNDLLNILIEQKPDNSKNVFMILNKNPRFYTILGIYNKQWVEYLEIEQDRKNSELNKKNIINKDEEEKTRKKQSAWREQLAAEMMNFTTGENEVFCPFTYITCHYNKVGTLFRASHIKEFEKCDVKEAFDINNGLLLCANADALFDKHLITINNEKELIFSFLLDQDYKLKSTLMLNAPIFKNILTNERMVYLKYHRQVFEEMEEKRKKNKEPLYYL